MDNKINIAVFEPYIFDSAYGNMKYILALFKYLARDKYKPVLISQRNSKFLEDIYNTGGTFEIVHAPKKLDKYGKALLNDNLIGKLSSIFAVFRFNIKLHRLFRKLNIRILQCHNIRGLILSCIAAKINRIPIIWYVKGHLENPLLDPIGFLLSDLILFQSESNKNRCYPKMVKRYKRKVKLLPNGVDLKEIIKIENSDPEILRKSLNLNDKKIYIAWIGQFLPHKGVHVLVDAMTDVLKKVPDIELFLIGDNCTPEYISYFQKIEKSIESRKLSCIHFLGYRTDAIHILSLMDIFVLPSSNEGVPRSIMEAMALGKPVISTSVGGVPDIVSHNVTGYVIPPDDKQKLSETIIKLSTDKTKRTSFGQCGRDQIYRFYDVETNVQRLSKMYDVLGMNH